MPSQNVPVAKSTALRVERNHSSRCARGNSPCIFVGNGKRSRTNALTSRKRAYEVKSTNARPRESSRHSSTIGATRRAKSGLFGLQCGGAT